MNVNALRDLMAFADENEMFGRGWKDSASSYNPKGRRAMWAAQMMGQGGGMGGQDFFAEAPAPVARPYVAAERIQPTQPLQGGMGPSMRPQAMNFLARLMGR